MPTFIRAWERCVLWVHGKLLMTAFSCQKVNLIFHQKDEGFDFIKNKKGELKVDPRNHIRSRDRNLILCNETCVIQFAYLTVTYAPLYATMDFDENNGKAGIRTIGMFEIIGRAMGITFPTKCPSNRLYQSF